MTPSRWTATQQSAQVWRVGGGAGRNEFVLYGDDAGARAMAKADELNARRDERLAAMVPTRPGHYWAVLDVDDPDGVEIVKVTAAGDGTLFAFVCATEETFFLSDWTFLSGPLEPPPSPE